MPLLSETPNRWAAETRTRPRYRVTAGANGPELVEDGTELVVIVMTTDGRRWDVVVDEEDVESLTVHSGPAASVSFRHLEDAPLRSIRLLAVTRAAQFRDAMASGANSLDAHLHPLSSTPADFEGEGPTLQGTAIPRAVFAEAWRDEGLRRVDDAGKPRPPRRKALSERFGVSQARVDDYIREARRHGDIPPARTGRGHKRPTETPAQTAPVTKKKDER